MKEVDNLAGAFARVHRPGDLPRGPVGHVLQGIVAQMCIALGRAGLLMAKDFPNEVEAIAGRDSGAGV